jgi:drug/metabolite transporter (DMT)-like permease
VTHAGELAALTTALCWTVTAMSFESASRRVGSLSVNFLRLLVALALLTLFGLIVRGRLVPVDASLHAWGWLALSGLVGFTIGDLCLFEGFVLVGARTTMLVSSSLSPLLAAVIGWKFLGDRLTGLDWVAMGITITGVAWVVLERQRDGAEPHRGARKWGILLGAGAGFGQGIGLVLAKYGMGTLHPFAATQIRVIAGAIGFALLFFAIRWWPRVRVAARDRGAMARLSLGAFFGPFLGVSMALTAVQRTATGVAATIMSLVPVFIIVPAILVFHERVSPRAFVGAIIAMGGVALLFLQ